MLDYIHLRTCVSAANGARGGGGERIPRQKGWRKPDVEHGAQGRCRAERAHGGVRDVLHASGDASYVRASAGQANGGP